MVIVKCRDCKEEKKLGKDAFFCPLIVNLHYEYNNVYGDYICKKCCRENFIQNTFKINNKGFATGCCYRCVFPIGAIEYTTFWFGDDAERNEHPLVRRYKRTGDGELVESDEYMFMLSDYRRRYYALKWDNDRQCIMAKPKEMCDGVEELFIKHGKLPTRVILTFDKTLSRLPLTWHEYIKYYWADYGHAQHFRDEEWMDKSPVFILPMYYNKTHGATIEEDVKTVKEKIEDNIKRKGSLYVLEYVEEDEQEE